MVVEEYIVEGSDANAVMTGVTYGLYATLARGQRGADLSNSSATRSRCSPNWAPRRARRRSPLGARPFLRYAQGQALAAFVPGGPTGSSAALPGDVNR